MEKLFSYGTLADSEIQRALFGREIACEPDALPGFAAEPIIDSDGERILIHRLWPRGISKREAKLDGWAKDLPPSNTLRRMVPCGLGAPICRN